MTTDARASGGDSQFSRMLRMAVMASIALGTVAMAIVGYWSWEREASEVNNNLQIQASFLASTSQAVFDNLGNGLAPLGELLSEQNVLSNPERARTKLLKFQTRFPEVGSMAVIRADGLMLINTASMPGNALPDYKNDIPFLRLLQASMANPSSYTLGPPENGKILRQWRFPFRYTVRNAAGEAMFVLQAAIPLEKRGIYLYDLPLPPSSYIGLLREDGLQQARWPADDPNDIYGRASPGPLAQLLREQPHLKEGVFSGYASWIPAGKDRIGAFKHLARLPLYAYVSVPRSYVWDRWWRNNIVTLATFLFYVSIIVFITKWVTRHERVHSSVLHGQARLDGLTGAPNRTGAEEQLQRQLGLSKQNGQPFAVMFIDMDRFKDINDTMGHSAGDELLVEVARRLRNHLRQDDVLARLGGDEFMTILPGADAAIAEQTASRLIQAFAEPFLVHGKKLKTSCSVGAALYPEHGISREGLLRSADTAMYESKRAGRNRFSMYEKRLGTLRQRRLTLREQLQRALEEEHLFLHFQPIFDLRSGRIVAAEALLRWEDELGRPHSPAEFIPIAEESGLILALGEWVLRQAAGRAQQWSAEGFPIRIAVNLSARQFQDPFLLDKVREALQKTGLPPAQLELEITESTAMEDPESSIRVLSALKELGISIAIDDFGTGYSSLSYLKRIPADKLKIDRSFIEGISNTSEDNAIVRSVLALAASLDIQTVAEGIEQEAQQQILLELGCQYGQGYLFSRPISAQAFEKKYFRMEPDLTLIQGAKSS